MTRLMIWLVCGLALAALAPLAPVASGQEGGARAAIEAANKQFSAAAAKGDAAAVANLYTPTGEAFPPNSNAVRGRAEIEKMWKSVLATGVTGITLTTTEVESAGDTAFEVGAYQILTKDGVADRGKYIVVWKRSGGRWMLHRDIWNTSQPPAK